MTLGRVRCVTVVPPTRSGPRWECYGSTATLHDKFRRCISFLRCKLCLPWPLVVPCWENSESNTSSQTFFYSQVSFLLSEEDAAFHFTGKVLLGSILACGDRWLLCHKKVCDQMPSVVVPLRSFCDTSQLLFPYANCAELLLRFSIQSGNYSQNDLLIIVRCLVA